MRGFSGWRVTAAGALGLGALFAAVLWAAGTDEAGLRTLVRATARASFGVFLVVYVAGPLRRLWPTPASRWLVRNRRHLGLTFAVAHGLHALAIGMLATLLGDAFRVPLLTTAGGGTAYALLAAMALTSNERAVRALGPRRWKALHRAGMHVLWVVFTFDWTGLATESPAYLPLAVLAWGAAALRLAALRARSRAPAGVPVDAGGADSGGLGSRASS